MYISLLRLLQQNATGLIVLSAGNTSSEYQPCESSIRCRWSLSLLGICTVFADREEEKNGRKEESQWGLGEDENLSFYS